MMRQFRILNLLKIKNYRSYKKIIFWLFQIVLWTAYYYYNIYIVHFNSIGKSVSNPLTLYSYLFLLCYFGIPLSLILAALYKRLLRKNETAVILFLYGLFISFLAANIWYAEIILLDSAYEYFGMSIAPHDVRYYFWEISSASLLLFFWSAMYLLARFWEAWQTQMVNAENSQLLAQNAMLKMLQYQLNPHFLFNSLSSIRALIRTAPETAENVISKLSEFLRYLLVNKDQQEVPFKSELEIAKHYLSIEKLRFEENLQFHFRIDPLAEDFPVPCYLIQPLLENAVKFGMDTSDKPITIEVVAEVSENTLQLEISNTGKWVKVRSGHRKQGTGTGLENIKQRLTTLYPEQHRINTYQKNGRVCIQIQVTNNPRYHN